MPTRARPSGRCRWGRRRWRARGRRTGLGPRRLAEAGAGVFLSGDGVVVGVCAGHRAAAGVSCTSVHGGKCCGKGSARPRPGRWHGLAAGVDHRAAKSGPGICVEIAFKPWLQSCCATVMAFSIPSGVAWGHLPLHPQAVAQAKCLPLNADGNELPAVSAEANPKRNESSMPHALVVDDDHDSAESLRALIAGEHFTVAVAHNLRDAQAPDRAAAAGHPVAGPAPARWQWNGPAGRPQAGGQLGSRAVHGLRQPRDLHPGACAWARPTTSSSRST